MTQNIQRNRPSLAKGSGQSGAEYLDGPVAIIGAGIGGLTAALSLQHSGVPVRVFEQARALREIGAGVTITPNAMNVLDFLGIGPALAEQAGDTVIAHFSNGTTFEAPALIGADGGASAVRDAVFGGQDASYTGHVALRALVPFTRVPQAVIADPYALYVGAGRSLIHYPLRRQTTMNLLGNAQASQWQAEGWSIPATVKEFLSLFEDFPEPVRELVAAIPEPDLFKWGLRDREPLPVWTRGRVTMLGDAAHPMTPYLGQGACMAIEDGMILGRAFAVSQDLEEAFSRYEAARRDRANGVQLAARYQGTQHHGSTASGPSSGKTAATLGLFSYNPVTESI